MIYLKNVNVRYPIYNNSFFKKKMLSYLFQKKNISNDYYEVLNNISLNMEIGDRVGLIGSNGAGKTTLLRVLLNVLPIYSGIYQNTFENILGLVSLDAGLNHYLNAEENIKTINIIYKIKENMCIDDINAIIEFAELQNFRDIAVRKFSSGMKLRLLFSVFTYSLKKCYILDEWLAVGDKEFKKKSEKKIYQIIDQAKLFVCASHNHEFLKNVCNKFFLIENKKITMITKSDF